MKIGNESINIDISDFKARRKVDVKHFKVKMRAVSYV